MKRLQLSGSIALPLLQPKTLTKLTAVFVCAGGPQPVLQVVSLHADATNRGPTFDLDLAELDGSNGQPLSYAAARQLLKSDPAVRSASLRMHPLAPTLLPPLPPHTHSP